MTPNIKVLEDLLGRLEKAEGADRELDLAIECALFGGTPMPRDPDRVHRVDGNGYGYTQAFACHTASLGAAQALVERVLPGTLWELYRIKAGGFMANLPDVDSGFGPTPALALLCALVRALISNADSAGPQDEGGGSSSVARLDASCAPPESGGQAGGGEP